MLTKTSYNIVIERFKAFADGHYLIRRFSHGQIDVTDIVQENEYPWMHVVPVSMTPGDGSMSYEFDVVFADLPRDKETPTEYQRESLSDCIRLAEDLISEIKNGGVIFGTDVTLEGGTTIEPFIEEYTHTLTGVNCKLSMTFPNDWSACEIPADWSAGGSGSGGSGGGGGTGIVLKVNGTNNVVQSLLDLVEGSNITITDLGDGRVQFDATGDVGATWGTIGGLLSNQIDLQNALNLKADITSLGAVAFSNDYNDLDNLPTIPAAQVNSDWNATSGVAEILNKPTIPAAQVNSDWDAVSGVAEILNKPTLAAVATSGDYNDLSNLPTIPTNLDDLGDVNTPTPSNGQVLTYNSISGDWEAATPSTGSGTVTSVGLTMPSAFNVANSPVTTSGTLAVTGAGTADQYVRGDGTLANFPSTGGGGGQIFYFNGNISQGTIGGNAYYQLGTAANTGPAANFTRATTGVIARFITDVGSPNHTIIPSGVWTIDVYLSETGGGANHAEILAKIYTYNGTAFTLIATSPVEEITNGNTPDLYTFTMSVPNTVTLATDRIHIEFDIQNTNGKTVTLYTEDGKIGEVHTTYAIGLSSLNGLTANTQTFAVGASGTDFAINSVGSIHTFNLPTASASNRGALSSADWSTFNGKLTGNSAITGATKTKITYDSKGLVTAGADLSASDIPSGIDATKISSGNVSNTEFDYLDGVTSAIQTQINGKQNTIGLTTVGTNLATLPNPNAIRYLRVNADNSVSSISAAQLATDLSIVAMQTAILANAFTNVGTGFESVTDLSFAVTANKTYKWRVTLSFTATATATFSVTGPSSPTFNTYRFVVSNAANSITIFNATAYDTGTNSAMSSNGVVSGEGMIRPTANGTVTIRVRCATAALLTLRAGSTIEYQEVI